MRKIMGVGIYLILSAAIFLGRPPQTMACVNWCAPKCSNKFEIVGTCTGVYITECCDSGSGQVGTCDPGYYSCNGSQGQSACCPYAGTPGGGGGGGYTYPTCGAGVSGTYAFSKLKENRLSRN